MGRSLRLAGGGGGVVVLLWLTLTAGLAAQRPAVSPALPRAWTQDTTISVWLFARPGVSLAAVADRATALGARVRMRSRWLHAVSVDAPTAALRLLARDPGLRRIQPLGRFRLPPGRPDPARIAPATAVVCDAVGDPTYGPSEMPYRQLHLRPLSDAGVDGAGVRIGILDTGFDTQNPAFTGITVTAQYDFVFRDTVVRNDSADGASDAHSHGTATWSLFAGDVPGRLRGVARGATYLLAKTEDVRSEMRVEEDNYVAALEWADSIGVDLVSSSLGYLVFDNGFSYLPSQLNGDVAVTTVAADLAAQRGILVVTAAGNSGPGFRTLGTPADGDSVLAIGAEDSLGNIAAFSSRGPTADGRLKPDFTAPGVDVCVVVGSGSVSRLNGTSFATPLIAASAALVKQLHPGLTPVQLRAAFRATATNRAAPDSVRGWGRPDVAASAVFPNGVVANAPLAGLLTSITPTFTWSAGGVPPSAMPVAYRLRLARDTGIATPFVDTTLANGQTYDLPRAVKPGAPIFWRVDATAATGETASTGRIGPLDVPQWATLTSLSDPGGSVTDSTQPTFTWTSPAIAAPPGPFSYDLFVQRVGDPFPEFGAGGLTAMSFRIPQALERNAEYRWFLVVHAGADTSLAPSLGSFLVVDGGVPAATLLYQNFPNPFPGAGRDSTCLWFDLATTGLVELEILDLRGNRLRRFIPGADFPPILTAGRYGRGLPGGGGGTCDPRLMWDGRADNGRLLPTGVYLYKLKAPGIVLFKRIVFRGR
ncbi:MAG TPA: S8 family serine peptidase [Gemmatimonadales bacterium]|nr:S8 family serine peptidase [Gemmatimonadales bacterium]